MDSISPLGLIRPVLNQQGAEWRGHVVAIGEGVKGLQWGDLVYLREKGNPTSVYLQNPQRDLAGWWGDNPCSHFADIDGSPGLVDVALAENLYIGDPEGVMYRINSLQGVCEGWAPQIEPLFNRILAVNAPRKSQTTSGIQLIADWYRGPNPVARIVGMGADVSRENLSVGDWVLLKPNRGTLIPYGRHELTLIEDKDIPISFGIEQPGLLTGWKDEVFQQVTA